MGAFLYLVLNAGGIGAQAVMGESVKIPGLLFTDPWTPLIGASAGVFGVIAAGAVFRPNETIVVLFVLPMRLATFAVLVIAFALYNMLSATQNAGGETAHIGGALAGWWSRGSGTERVAASTVEVDRILDKVSAGGLQSLSAAEKDTLRRASDARRS